MAAAGLVLSGESQSSAPKLLDSVEKLCKQNFNENIVSSVAR
jgi:hypothetical protein